jgi:hypothetical protein
LNISIAARSRSLAQSVPATASLKIQREKPRPGVNAEVKAGQRAGAKPGQFGSTGRDGLPQGVQMQLQHWKPWHLDHPSDRRITPKACNVVSGCSNLYMKNELSVSSNGNNPGSGVVWTTLPARAEANFDSQKVTNRLTAYNAENLICLSSVDFTKKPGEGNGRRPLHAEMDSTDDCKRHGLHSHDRDEIRVYVAAC